MGIDKKTVVAIPTKIWSQKTCFWGLAFLLGLALPTKVDAEPIDVSNIVDIEKLPDVNSEKVTQTKKLLSGIHDDVERNLTSQDPNFSKKSQSQQKQILSNTPLGFMESNSKSVIRGSSLYVVGLQDVTPITKNSERFQAGALWSGWTEESASFFIRRSHPCNGGRDFCVVRFV